jgi:DNA-binding transcriptional ArsR family regulator
MAEGKKSDWWARQEKKWTKNTFKNGYTVLPHSLFECVGRLGIRATQQAVLFHLLDFCFDELETREVSKAELASRIKMDARQVQRHLRKLEEMGLITSGYPNRPGRHAKVYRFDGLVKKLSKLAKASRSEKKLRLYRNNEAIWDASKSL